MTVQNSEIKLLIDPTGSDWVFAYFMNTIVDALFEKDLFKLGLTVHKVRQGPFKKWKKTGRGSVLMTDLILTAKENGFPVTLENDLPYLILDEKSAMMEFMKYAHCHNTGVTIKAK